MQKDIQDLKVTQALLEQRQEQTDKVIEKLSSTLESLDSKVTKGFYVALGVMLVSSDSASTLGKLVIKFIGG